MHSISEKVMKKIYVPEVGYTDPNQYQYLLREELEKSESIRIGGSDRRAGTTTILANYLADKMAQVEFYENLIIMFFSDTREISKNLERITIEAWLYKHLSGLNCFINDRTRNYIIEDARNKFGLTISNYDEYRIYGYDKNYNYIFVNSFSHFSKSAWQTTIGRQFTFPNKQIIMEQL